MDQRPHAQTPRDEEGLEMHLGLESVGQGKGGQDADAVSDGGFQALRGIGVVVDVDELEGVVIAAGDDGAKGTEEIEGFEVGVDEGEDAVVRGHFLFRRWECGE